MVDQDRAGSPRQSLAALTTLRVGGPAARILAPDTTAELVDAALGIWGEVDEWIVLGGGSNVVVADEGFDGTVLRTAVRGIAEVPGSAPGRVRLRVEAGTPWDDLVAYTVERGLAGIEALSGIPGSTGAAPIQNIGAYGQEVGATLVAVDFLDYLSGAHERLAAGELELGYRTSVFKRGRQGIVTAAEFELVAGGLGAPVAYAQLARSLEVAIGDRVPVLDVREAVLELRRSKGMVLDEADPDSRSAGSFFTNPIVSERFARTLPDAAPRWPVRSEDPDLVLPLGVDLPAELPERLPGEAPQVKLSAAWLIEHAGITRGFALPGSRAGISGKHSLAIVNRGGATAAEVVELARYVQAMVQGEFGLLLHPEPVLVGFSL
jgi:UDP-N-acetylmuramate dehydrogenase